MTHVTFTFLLPRARLAGIAFVLLLAAATGTAQERLVLASAQVVTAIDGPPTLHLAASGPIAFTRLPPVEGVAGPHIVVRLHGVTKVDLASSGGLAPFGILSRAGDGFVDLTVTLGSDDGRLDVRQGRLPHEMDVVVLRP